MDTEKAINTYEKCRISLLNKPLLVRILLIALIFATENIVAISLIYKWKENGTLIASTQASADIPDILLQNLMISVVPIIIFLIFLLGLKKDFWKEMYLEIKGKWQWSGIFALLLCLVGILIYHLIIGEDRVTSIYLLFYYVFVIAFTEEFISRGACTYLLKNEKIVIRFVVPNLLFAAIHIFNYSGWNTLTYEHVVRFLRNDMIVIFAVGCLNQALKEKTGTLWIPILLHAAWDFALAYK